MNEVLTKVIKCTPRLPPNMNEDVYTLSEGDAVFYWPDQISPESYQELKDWTALLLRKIARHVKTPEEGTS